MKFELLIDNIVRQTTVLIAQLATAAGGRAPLAHVAGQVFLSLVNELKDQGLGNKVIADMFGLALRTYHNRVRRYSESATDRGVSLWEAVVDYVEQHEPVTRAKLMQRFYRDDEELVRAVLKDLVDSGVLYRSGRGEQAVYRGRDARHARPAGASDPELVATHLVWVALHQRGASDASELIAQLGLNADQVRNALEALVAEGRAKTRPKEASGEPMFEVEHCVIPYGDEHGWEAALFDHYQAMVTAIAAKVRQGATRSAASEATGGSTYHFDVYDGHPLEQEVLGFLAEVRRRASSLRARINATREAAGAVPYRIVFYAGQNVIGKPDARGGVEE